MLASYVIVRPSLILSVVFRIRIYYTVFHDFSIPQSLCLLYKLVLVVLSVRVLYINLDGVVEEFVFFFLLGVVHFRSPVYEIIITGEAETEIKLTEKVERTKSE